MPNNGILLEARTVVISLALGILVTLIASFFPALRATRVPPIAAVREGAELPPGRFHRFRTPFAALLTALGFALLVVGLFAHGTSTVLLLLILGTLLVFIGVAMLSAPFIPALSGILGWPATKIGGAAGTLARDNARRNPQRTASTAAALMIGLALVTLVATLAAGITASFKGAVNDIFTGDYAITAQNNFSPIPISIGKAAAQAPGVISAGSVRTGETLVFGKTAVHDRGDAGGKGRDRAAMEERLPGRVRVARRPTGRSSTTATRTTTTCRLGSPIPVTFVTGKTRTFTREGHLRPAHRRLAVRLRDDLGRDLGRREPAAEGPLHLRHGGQGGTSDANAAKLEQSLAGYPNAKVQTRQQFIDNQIGALNSILNILYVLLALSIIVSLFGIVNTLVLTVFERTREIGMLRAIGLTRRQTRRMIRHESVITALIGAFVGIVLGLILAGILIAKVDFLVFSFPTTQVIVFTVAAIIVGILAAIFPARRAARLNPLEALHYE